MYWLPEHARTSAKYELTEYGLPTARDPTERAKSILKLHYLTPRWFVRKIQRALCHRENWQKWLMF